jgi:hypothetical protein
MSAISSHIPIIIAVALFGVFFFYLLYRFIVASKRRRSVGARVGGTGPMAIQADQAPRRRVTAARMGWTGRVVAPQDHVGIVRRRFGGADPVFLRITPHNQRGVQARTLLPGRPARLVPGLYAIELVPRVHVPEGMIGLVVANEGQKRPATRLLGQHVECDSFQDGQAFLLRGGEQGRQAVTLAGDHFYHVNTQLFDIQYVPRTRVPVGTVGLVIARAGRVRAPDRPFARHVECDNFQDGQAFLDGGGEQGRQLAVLIGGTSYDINPALFDVITTATVAGTATPDGLTAGHLQEIAVPIGYTGVVITLDGAEPGRGGPGTVGPWIKGHRSFRLPWVFLGGGGHRGVQEETIGEGTVCALNPWFARVVLIPTRVLILEWNDKPPAEGGRNFDAELDRITVTIQGHRVHMELSQTLRIPEKAAPKLVSTFGGSGSSRLGGLVHDPLPVQRFVEKVLGATVASYLSGIASTSTVQEFLLKYTEARTDLATQVRIALESWDVEAISTNLGSFEADDQKLNAELQAEASAQLHRSTLNVLRDNVLIEDEIDQVRFRPELRRAALELRAEIDALGLDNVALIRMIREMSGMQVPDYIGGDISSYAEALPMPVLRDLMSRLREMRSDRELPPKAPPQLTED